MQTTAVMPVQASTGRDGSVAGVEAHRSTPRPRDASARAPAATTGEGVARPAKRRRRVGVLHGDAQCVGRGNECKEPPAAGPIGNNTTTGAQPSVASALSSAAGAHPPATLVSGGCRGTDVEWARAAASHGRRVNVMSFGRHDRRSAGGDRDVLLELSNTQLWTAQAPVRMAGQHLGRRAGIRGATAAKLSYRDKLLCRNWHIVKDATHLLAVGTLTGAAQHHCMDVGVDGGTGWSCQLFADAAVARIVAAGAGQRLASAHKGGGVTSAVPLNMHVYDQQRRRWYQCGAVPLRPARAQPKPTTKTKPASLMAWVTRAPRTSRRGDATGGRAGAGAGAGAGAAPHAPVVMPGAPRWRLQWVTVNPSEVCLPATGRVALVGSRSLSQEGRDAIHAVFAPAVRH